MSEKTVKITNGKILNYTIKVPGYKTIIADKLITENSNITHTMLPEISEDGIYAIGDRIGNIATFIGYFGAINRDTSVAQKYAIFVVDAKYRLNCRISNSFSGRWPDAPNLPYYDPEDKGLDAKDSATWNTDTVLNAPDGATKFPGFSAVRNAAEITIGNTTYKTQFHNLYELKKIWENRKAIDAVDPTISTYPQFALSSWFSYTCSSTVRFDTGMYGIRSGGSVATNAPGYGATLDSNFYVFPIFEIPVN